MGKLETREAALSTLHANPWNPNKMTDRTFEAERESIAKFGFIDPITVRQHPELKDQYQIIDGEHRSRAALELGMTDVPIAIIHDLSDGEAKKLTIILNETRGSANTLELAVLLSDIAETDTNLIEALPYDETQLSNLLEISKFEMPDYGDGEAPAGSMSADGAEGWEILPMRVPASIAKLFSSCSEAIKAEHELKDQSDQAIANGQILEALCAAYLAS